MSRDGGFPVGDRSSRTLYDVRLVRATRKAGLAAIVAWDAIVDASWEAGCRVQFDDAIDTLPYDLGDTKGIRSALTSVGLLGEDGLIREESWASWFGVAYGRREATRERGRRYNASKRGDVNATSDARRNDVEQQSNDKSFTPPFLPSGPTDRTVPPARARESAPSKDGATLRETLTKMGLRTVEG